MEDWTFEEGNNYLMLNDIRATKYPLLFQILFGI